MNSTQKGAWIMLSGILLSAISAAYVGSIILLGRVPPRPAGPIVVGFVAFGGLACLALSVFSVARRQSRVEPESDERDKAIMKNAVLAGFATVWILLASVVVVLGRVLGQTGSIPVYVLTLILLGVLAVTTVVYSVAILVQYGRPIKETSHE